VPWDVTAVKWHQVLKARAGLKTGSRCLTVDHNDLLGTYSACLDTAVVSGHRGAKSCKKFFRVKTFSSERSGRLRRDSDQDGCTTATGDPNAEQRGRRVQVGTYGPRARDRNGLGRPTPGHQGARRRTSDGAEKRPAVIDAAEPGGPGRRGCGGARWLTGGRQPETSGPQPE
jgi:hypothetical protein